jgi:hypothetical protein
VRRCHVPKVIVVSASSRSSGSGRRRRALVLLLAAGLLSVGAAEVQAVDLPGFQATEHREAWRWPFSAESPWNYGVGQGARFEQPTDPATSSLLDPRAKPWVNTSSYSHPVVRASGDDPVATVTLPNGRPPVQLRIPGWARPAQGGDGHLHVVEPGGRYVDETFKLKGANPSWTAGHHARIDLHGPGVGTDGTRAYGGSAIAGLIRTWELEAGTIRHALALAVPTDQLRAGPVWPATREDRHGARSYRGGLPMGAFAAIPPDVDVEALGLSPEGLVVARALQRYGAYVVDAAAGSFVLYAEPGAPAEAISRLRADVGRLRGHLRVVANNGPKSVNGGGAPRSAPPAPPFG